ncbi:MAG: HsmA family protein [Patescibacteria group bacterium]|jgi:uncharacterized repeat protein (TIGR03987 family)
MRFLELLFVAALILYTTAIWADRIKGELHAWMVKVFIFGFLCDVFGTILVCVTVTGAWHPTLHMLTGTASLVIMALHLAWAIMAMSRGERSEACFRRWSIPAWLLWLVSFLSGAFLP